MTRELGKSGIQVPRVILGGNVFGWTADAVESFKLLDAALDAGLYAIDTADVYSRFAPGNAGGESEAIIGVWLKERKNRGKLVLLTKVGMDMGGGKTGLSKARIVQAVEASLTRLQTDYIDFYQAHRDDEATPLEETLEAFAALVKAGKVRAIGASNYSAARLKQALEISKANGWPRYESLQPLYNLVERPAFEAELAPLTIAENVGVIPYFALAAGFLTGKYRKEGDFASGARGQGVKKYFNEKGLRVLAALDEQAARTGATQAQIAIAWNAQQPGVTAPIASATSLKQLEDIVKAEALVLDDEAIRALNEASA